MIMLSYMIIPHILSLYFLKDKNNVRSTMYVCDHVEINHQSNMYDSNNEDEIYLNSCCCISIH